jgi:DNA polymerase-3 subunit gamma/tau
MAYQSLYRRYRPRRFSEVRGQEHLVTALRNAVKDDRVGHAYLFSGPRGTGKTSTARILAKVLNCEHPVEGEPDCECASCLAIEAGTSFDVHELDAASNNGVEAIRDLIAKASLGTPGRTKVYILDEVHMLSAAASNALLKTLEEPPDHVVFVLATTDPQKVLPTIRSRTQHFEVHLLPATELRALVEFVIADAGLEVPSEGVTYVLRAGGGSARDTLSALDRVVAAGGVPDSIDAVDDLVEALCERDTGRALVAVEQALSRGRNPRVLGESLIGRLRDVFLASVAADLSRLPEQDQERVADQARRLGAPGATRALELLGEAFVGIQDALDPRIPLEVALVRLTRVDADTSVAALAERLARLERGAPAPQPTAPAAPRPTSTAPTPPPPTEARAAAEHTRGDAAPTIDAPTPPPETLLPQAETAPEAPGPEGEDSAGDPADGGRPADGARQVLRQRATGPAPRPAPAPRSTRPKTPTPPPPPGPPRGAPSMSSPPASGPPASGPSGSTAPATGGPSSGAPRPSAATAPAAGALPSRDELTLAWGDGLLAALPQRAKARFGGGHWVRVDDDAAVFGFPNQHYVSRSEECRADVEAALGSHFGRAVPIRIVVDGDVPEPGAPARPAAAGAVRSASAPTEPDEPIDLDDLTDAHDVTSSGVDRIAAVFPGAELVSDDDS